ncbi:MAG: DUF4920 domain-containing protein [Bdellovibrionales bacterium]|nr:DUF4920 domain-containing protein [Bdellovibrionales bacterium]
MKSNIIKLIILFSVSICFAISALAEKSKETTSSEKTKFGAAVAAEGVVGLDEILAHPKENISKKIVAVAKVSKVCKAKGCWMEVSGDKEKARVTFKNYGFFVPQNILDKKIRIQGELTEKTMSVKEQKHYLADEGRSKEDIAAVKEPKFVYEFVADGVEIVN